MTKNKQGFSLMEVLVAMSIFSLVFILGGRFITTGFRMTTFGSEQEDAIKHARQAIEIMTKEIRGANNSQQGDYPLSIIEDDIFEFYSDIDYDGEFERIKYVFEDTEIKKVITSPGPLNDYNQPHSTTTIAQFMNNQDEPVFIYYDSDRNETVDIDSIRLIRIVLRVNVTPWRMPNDYYVETDVHLRNLKDNL